MLKFIENLLSAFRSCFSRTRTYEWFLVIVSALLVRYDSLGVTSFVRVFSLDHRLYGAMLHFFRSSAYKTAVLKTCWHKIIHRNAPLIRIGGRPRKKGESVHVMDLFESRRHDFIASTVFMYGKEQKVEYLSLNLLWGIKLYQELQFVLVKYDNVTSILVTADLNLAPTPVIEAYAHRFKIERMFREMKQQIHGFSYHFWNSKIPKLNKYKKKSDPGPLTFIREEDRLSVLSTVEAIERFVLCSEISMGIIQMMALNPAFVEMIERRRYLRTSRKGRVH